MTKIQNNELTHTANSGTSNIILGSSGQVTTQGVLTPTGGLSDNCIDGANIALGSDAAGDIMYYNGTDYVRLGKGTNGHYLKQGSSNAPEWAAVSAANVLQVKIDTQGGSDIQSSYSSSTLTDMNSVTITPVATSSKFLVWANYRGYRNGNGDVSIKTGLVRNVDGGGFSSLYDYSADTVNQITNSSAYQKAVRHFYLDAPTYDASEALIYKSQAASNGSDAINLGRYTELLVIELASGTAP